MAHINEGSHLPLLIYHMFPLTSMPPLLLVLLPCMFRLCHALYITNDDCDDETDNVKLNFIIQYKIQALFKDFQGPKLHFFQAQKLSTKSHILDMDIQNLDCNATLKCTVLYSPIP